MGLLAGLGFGGCRVRSSVLRGCDLLRGERAPRFGVRLSRSILGNSGCLHKFPVLKSIALLLFPVNLNLPLLSAETRLHSTFLFVANVAG